MYRCKLWRSKHIQYSEWYIKINKWVWHSWYSLSLSRSPPLHVYRCISLGAVIHQHKYKTQRVRHCIDYVAIEIFCFSALPMYGNGTTKCYVPISIIHVKATEGERERRIEKNEKRTAKKEYICLKSTLLSCWYRLSTLTKQHNIISYLPTVNSQWEIRLVIRLLVCVANIQKLTLGYLRLAPRDPVIVLNPSYWLTRFVYIYDCISFFMKTADARQTHPKLYETAHSNTSIRTILYIDIAITIWILWAYS